MRRPLALESVAEGEELISSLRGHPAPFEEHLATRRECVRRHLRREDIPHHYHAVVAARGDGTHMFEWDCLITGSTLRYRYYCAADSWGTKYSGLGLNSGEKKLGRDEISNN